MKKTCEKKTPKKNEADIHKKQETICNKIKASGKNAKKRGEASPENTKEHV